MIRSLLELGLQALLSRWRLVLLMALVIALPLTGFLVLDAYRAGLNAQFSGFRADLLVVQSTGSMGEFMGSRLPASLIDELKARGVRHIYPEIHTTTGTSSKDAILLRGIPLESYHEVEDYTLFSGRALQPGDPSRSAMVGSQLAEWQKISSGGVIEIRGRQFQVLGIFHTETYKDFEAWIPLNEAQSILGWGNDISIIKIKTGEGVQVGEQLPDGSSATAEGSSAKILLDGWKPMLDLMGSITSILELATAVILSTLLWRLAWLHRRELAIFRSLGFSRCALIFYLVEQSLLITLVGFGFGCMVAFVIGLSTQVNASGISTHPLFSPTVLAISFGSALVIALIGSILPAWQLYEQNLSALLRDE